MKKAPSKKYEYTKEYLEFYAAYPRKESKLAGFKAYQKVTDIYEVPHEILISGARKYTEHLNRNGTPYEFTKLPASWLNAGCWDDEYSTQASAPARKRTYEDSLQTAAENAAIIHGQKEDIRH